MEEESGFGGGSTGAKREGGERMGAECEVSTSLAKSPAERPRKQGRRWNGGEFSFFPIPFCRLRGVEEGKEGEGGGSFDPSRPAVVGWGWGASKRWREAEWGGMERERDKNEAPHSLPHPPFFCGVTGGRREGQEWDGGDRNLQAVSGSGGGGGCCGGGAKRGVGGNERDQISSFSFCYSGLTCF